jgi:hypothetical protein
MDDIQAKQSLDVESRVMQTMEKLERKSTRRIKLMKKGTDEK